MTLLEEINSDEMYEEVTKQYHTTNVTDLHVKWQHQNADLVTRECLSKDRSITCRKTFTKYVPNQVSKKHYISQFACGDDIEFEWLHQAVMKILRDHHQCGGPNICVIYDEEMKTICTCETCTNCFILELKTMPPKPSLHRLCCDNDYTKGI